MQNEFEISLSYGNLRGIEFGQGNPRKVLAVHGWLDNAASFTHLAPLLNDSHVVAVDLPGHGLSDHRAPGSAYHLLDYLPTLVELVHKLGWQSYVAMGHSLGAGICSLLAATQHTSIESLILIDGVGPVAESADKLPDRLTRSIQRHSQLKTKRLPVYKDLGAALKMRLDVTTMNPSSAELIVQRNLQEVKNGVTWRTDRRVTLASPAYLMEEQVEVLLRSIRCPGILIQAGDGVLTERKTTTSRVACIDNIQCVQLPGNHHFHLDTPELVATPINRFLVSAAL
ncbi:MAG: pimeloyl-ACP methyl ester carboxylesterase [Parasphingorhabdus sp.]|jgi:pimeloyl-ACP methyl ester carboxylesterase